MPFYPEAIETKTWRRDALLIIKKHKQIQLVNNRIKSISQAFVGRPYLANGLHGSSIQDERLLLDLGAFDCVTLVENVIALARARDLAGYVAELVHLRYRAGQINWLQRLHYFSDWMQANAQRGVIKIVDTDDSLVYTKKLDALAGYPAREHSLSVCPRKGLLQIAPLLGETNVVVHLRLHRPYPQTSNHHQ